MAMMLQNVWRRHNDKVWDGELKKINIAVQIAPAKKQTSNIYVESSTTNNNLAFCLNSNATRRCFGICVGIQNYRGHFTKAATTWHEGNPPPKEAEAVGLHDAIYWLGL